jgi:helix-turn-helix protein
MPDIGSTLREARMRARIDISEIEAETKIRAKYLRALENEEWDLLPGPTYVKSFLRTYADALGLDGKLLVEEYKLRYERLSDVDLQPISPVSSRRDGRRPPREGIPGGAVIGVVVVLLVAALYLLGIKAGNDNSNQSGNAGTGTTTTTAPAAQKKKSTTAATHPAPKKHVATLRIVPTGPVYVCLKAAGARTLVNGVILQAGSVQPTYRSSRFRLTLGNGEARMIVNGTSRAVPATGGAVNYEVTTSGRRTLPATQAPKCA